VAQETVSEKKVRPIFPNLLVRLDEKPEYVGRILLPDTAKEHPKRGTVVRLPVDQPEDHKFKALVGERILFQRYAGTEHPDDKTLLMMREDDILAVLEK
jgi:co-chaperonin GroES (HSP10)